MTLAHEAALHAAQLRVELSQSKREQREYLKNVELARVLDKRAKRKAGGDGSADAERPRPKKERDESARDAPTEERRKKRQRIVEDDSRTEQQLDSMLGSIF